MSSMRPCPECKSTAVHIAEWFDDYTGESSYYGVCDSCGYEAQTHKDDYDAAVDHWNRRASRGQHDADEFAADPL